MDKFEGALGKGKGRKWYAYKVMMTKVRHRSPVFRLFFLLLHFWPITFFLFLCVRNGLSFKEILRILEPLVFPGRGRSKRWRVSFVSQYFSRVFIKACYVLKFCLNAFRPLWLIGCILLHISAMDVWHEPRFVRPNLWAGGHS